MVRYTGLQKDVLALYRQCLRAVRDKPSATRSNFRAFARAEFRKHISISKKDFSTIEYLLRRGRNQLESYHDPEIRNIYQ
ncbi:complex 1 protein-domain-containing protein [Massariosphaeria phaeospora]|uniref:Complex 1 protein-domain-containing protein n=1 Tax=Massariosphaeria phaeospora TaxID=100035 RepID=A0A7C8ICQ8_9PLEO|nr:complex 1 protein-domain-containing protein [Massariosphaeria phaeospora]